jgi:hypothetical protein
VSEDLIEIMSKARIPIQRASLFAYLDDAEILEGYEDGRRGDPEPGDNRSFSYWHGWRAGSVDGGHREKDAAGMALAKDMIESGYLKRLRA